MIDKSSSRILFHFGPAPHALPITPRDMAWGFIGGPAAMAILALLTAALP